MVAFSFIEYKTCLQNKSADFALGTSAVQIGGEDVGVSFRIAIKKPLHIDDDATDIHCWHTECQQWFLFSPAAGMSLS